MGLLSDKLVSITFGTVGAPTPPRISRANFTGPLAPAASPAGINVDAGNGLWANCDFGAVKVWNAVWNDVADFQLLADKLEYGRSYYDTKDGAKICNKRCQKSVIGIASNTYGFAVGSGANPGREVPIGVAGWVLAYLDQEYDSGTALTNDEQGRLTKMTFLEKILYPERMIAIYKKAETASHWGPEGSQIEVMGRHWVKVK